MSSLVATGVLTRLVLRRDRVRLTVWVTSIVLTIMGSVASFASTYPTAADRLARAKALDTPIASLFVGPNYAKGNYTYGAMTAHELLTMSGIAVALMSILLVIRFTRAEEEEGREDVVRSLAVGRHASSAAALTVVVSAQLTIAVCLAFGLPFCADDVSLRGSIAFAAALASIGLVFAAIAAVAAQLTVTARAAIGLSSAALGALYLVRAVGDMGSGALSALSPFGWANQVRAYVDERWWVLLVPSLATVLLTGVAVAVGASRDVGAGMLADRRGPDRGSPSLATPFALAVRLQRATLLSWSLGMLALGAVYGAVASQASTLYENVDAINKYLARIGVADASDQYLALTLFISALIASAWSIQSTLRVRSEEIATRAEVVLSEPLSRRQFAMSYLLVSMIGSAVVLAAYGVGEGVARSIDAGDLSQLPRLAGAALSYVPALWVFAALALAAFGLAPRATNVVWGVFAAFAFVGFLGPLLKVPDWLYNLSPIEHVPRVPVASFSIVPLLGLCAIAAALTGLGLRGFDRREVG